MHLHNMSTNTCTHVHACNAYIHRHIHSPMSTYPSIHMHAYSPMHTCKIYPCAHTHAHPRGLSTMHTHMHTHCTYLHTYIHSHMHTSTLAHTHTHRTLFACTHPHSHAPTHMQDSERQPALKGKLADVGGGNSWKEPGGKGSWERCRGPESSWGEARSP